MQTRHGFGYLVTLIGIALTATGCPLLLIGAAGVAGGYMISNDTAKATLERHFDAVWAVTRQEVQKMAAITVENKSAGTMEAKMSDETNLWVTLTRPTKKNVVLTVKARKNLLPKPQAAQQVMGKVLKRF